MKNKIIALIVAILVALSFYNVASAHHPVIVGTPTRECGAESPWNATFTATSDQDWNKDWRSQYKLDSGTLSAWSSWVDDQVPFGPWIEYGEQAILYSAIKGQTAKKLNREL